mmetsp:Transcript_49970/g.89804  ORF Transcript_49970/g.89804 Transcript_49970/m.89804 type:complete len:219 (+) Transcript_49970:779-1435(+)
MLVEKTVDGRSQDLLENHAVDVRRNAQGEAFSVLPAHDPERRTQEKPKQVAQQERLVVDVWIDGHGVGPVSQHEVAKKIRKDLDEEYHGGVQDVPPFSQAAVQLDHLPGWATLKLLLTKTRMNLGAVLFFPDWHSQQGFLGSILHPLEWVKRKLLLRARALEALVGLCLDHLLRRTLLHDAAARHHRHAIKLDNSLGIWLEDHQPCAVSHQRAQQQLL